jgi:hypothetical protein
MVFSHFVAKSDTLLHKSQSAQVSEEGHEVSWARVKLNVVPASWLACALS